MTRRDKCYLTGIRAAKLNRKQSAWAWHVLSAELEVMGSIDVPKFQHLLRAIRLATIAGRKWK